MCKIGSPLLSFLLCSLCTPLQRFFKDDILGNGAIFASISKNELLNQVFVIPDEKIMSAYEKIAAALDKKIEVVDMQLQQLVEARDRLLPKLMNGEIEV